jgi:hypothetical protein
MIDWGLILSDVRLSVQVKTYDKIFFNLENECITDVKFMALNKYMR